MIKELSWHHSGKVQKFWLVSYFFGFLFIPDQLPHAEAGHIESASLPFLNKKNIFRFFILNKYSFQCDFKSYLALTQPGSLLKTLHSLYFSPVFITPQSFVRMSLSNPFSSEIETIETISRKTEIGPAI